MQILPAIDIIDGKCVRLVQGDYNQKTIYGENPLDVAKSFEDAGMRRLHLVDLDGAKASHIVNYKVLESIAKGTNLHIDFGGGLKTNNDLKIAFESGAKQITGGSIAVKNPDLFAKWIEQYGSEKIILGADVIGENIAVSGWQETSDNNLFDFLKKYLEKGLEYVICTDISKDGMMQGSSIELYKKILAQFPDIRLIASGGVTTEEEVYTLKDAGLYGAIIGKAIYEGTIKLSNLKSCIK